MKKLYKIGIQKDFWSHLFKIIFTELEKSLENSKSLTSAYLSVRKCAISS